MGNDVYIFLRNELPKSIIGALEQSSSRSEEVDKLFGVVFATLGPKATTDPSAHNDAIVIVHIYYGSILRWYKATIILYHTSGNRMV